MMTLMPVAAFAATTYVDVVDDDALIKANGYAKVEVAPVTTDSVYVFAVNGSGTMYNDLKVVDVTTNADGDEVFTAADSDTKTTGVRAVNLTVGDMDSFNARFFAEGKYTIYVVPVNDGTAAVVADPKMTKAQKVSLLKDEAYKNLDAEITVKASKTNYHFSKNANHADGDSVGTATATIAKANGVDKATVTLYLHNADGDPVVGAKVDVSTNSSAVDVSKTTVTTNAAGQVKFDVTANIAGNYEVYVEYGNKADVTVEVSAETTGAAAIETKYNGSKVDLDTDLADTDMMFTITDINGNIIKTDASLGKYYVKVVSAPAGSAVTNAALEDADLVYNANEAAWYLTGVELDEEGNYELKVVLDNGAYATATVEVKEFQKPVEIRLEYKAPSVELNGYNFMKDLKFIDANGVKTSKGTEEIKLAATGYAIDNFASTNSTLVSEKVYFVKDSTDWKEVSKDVYDKETDPDKKKVETIYYKKGTVKAKADEKYVGQTITVTAVSTKYNLTATTSMVVANEASEVKYADTKAEVAVNNTLTANIVDKDGNKVALKENIENANISYVVLEKPENSKVAISTQNAGNLAQKGEFKVSFTASVVGNYKVQTVVTYEQADGVVKYYSGIETITVGTDNFDDIVVMSIGSNEIVVNAAKATIDAAPMIQNDRTYVPFRALAEAFGAEVAYDEATQAVTAELNGVTVVMTIGSATYTVNGVEKTADVAPFINGSRTMIPVRFAAEAFGITVTPTYDANGATADVLFAK